jgi:3-phenylpropionate/trans-cinnamate dioxygenase ferredoxin subunit
MSVPEGYVEVMAADEVEDEMIYPFVVEDEERVLTRVDGQIYALEGICTHEYAELADGEIEDETLWCPLHSSGFNVRTGEVTNLPAVIPLKTYDVKVIDGTVYVSVAPRDGGEE